MKIVVEGQPRQKVSETSISTNKPSMVFMTVIPAMVEAIYRKIRV
jgi:hypothetical protein